MIVDENRAAFGLRIFLSGTVVNITKKTEIIIITF